MTQKLDVTLGAMVGLAKRKSVLATALMLAAGSMSLVPCELVAKQVGTSPDNIAVHNLMPGFWHFWEAANGRPPDQQLQSWESLYIQPNSKVFADLAAPCAKHLTPEALKRDYFPTLSEYISQIHSIENSMPALIEKTRLGFVKVFPDMRWSGEIYIMASAGCFNGRSQQIQGRDALLLGLDDIAELHETNLPPLLDHELFHRYQHAFFPFEPERNEPLWVRLWAEGMATYVSRKLNPSATNMDTLWIDDAHVKELDSRIANIAADFLNHFASTSPRQASLYFLDDESKDPNIPARAGYYLGLRVAERLGKKYSVQEMAHWNRSQAEPHIGAALKQMQEEKR